VGYGVLSQFFTVITIEGVDFGGDKQM